VSTPISRLRPIDWLTPTTPQRKALVDLERYADRLRSAAKALPYKHHALALALLADWRIYGFEQNRQRWPDGLFYMLDRGYSYWRGHRLGFTDEELRALGLGNWDRRAVRTAYSPGFRPMQTDCFQYSPRRFFPEFANIVAKLAEHVAAREELRDAKTEGHA
jgi:hypothetical protein